MVAAAGAVTGAQKASIAASGAATAKSQASGAAATAGGKSVGGVAGAVSNVYVAQQRSIQVRAIERETTKRKRITANVNIAEIREKYRTRRKSIIKDEFVSYRNSSDEVLHSFDRPVFEQVEKTKGGRKQRRISLSMLSMMGLGAPFLSSTQDPRLNAIGQIYQSNFVQMYQNSQYFQRNTSSSGITFNLPSDEQSYEEIMNEGRDEALDNQEGINQTTRDIINFEKEKATEEEKDSIRRGYANQQKQIWLIFLNVLREKYGKDWKKKLTDSDIAKIEQLYQKYNDAYFDAYGKDAPEGILNE